ncbi:hypothetical protein [Streptomyces sp. NPDC048256]|uniref:hypothetical protein n=1 Tax=Streptomyces sp. NPDC048256 TaxID=3154613 RepID=UPI0033D694A0
MNTPKATRRVPRTPLFLKGVRAARRRTQFVGMVARQLDLIAPGTVRVAVAPLVVADRPRTWVDLLDADGRAVATSREQCRAAHGLLSRAFPEADWNTPRVYDARTGYLTAQALAAPAALGLDTMPEARQ